MLSLVVYPGRRGYTHLVQFRLRRSQHYRELDLRRILDAFSIKNGGGHPGAIGFRLPEEEVPDVPEYSRRLIRGIEGLMDEAPAG